MDRIPRPYISQHFMAREYCIRRYYWAIGVHILLAYVIIVERLE